MIDFSKVKTCRKITQDFVLSKIDDATIFYHYFGPFDFKKVYRSVFSKDRNPSTGFYVNESGVIKYSDFRTRTNWNCFAFVAEMYRISYAEALERVAIDFGLIEGKPAIVSKKTLEEGSKVDRSAKAKTAIQIKPDLWNKKYLNFWNVYDITMDELIENEVYPVRELYINKKLIYNPNNDVRYAYRVVQGGEEFMKVYSPYNKHMKWVSNIPLNVPFGLEALPKQSKTLIITKSQKDRIVLKKCFEAVMATQNESEAALTPEIINILNTEHDFENKIIFWDNDETGVESCKKFNDRGFGYFNIPNKYREKYGIKDASDYVAYFGVDALKELFTQKGIL